MEIRLAQSGDIGAFVQLRADFVCALGCLPDRAAFTAATEAYLNEHLGSDLLIRLAVDGERIAASAMLQIYDTPPLPSCLNGRHALLLNVWTDPDDRRRGLARRLVETLIADACEREVGMILLNSTDDGLPLYKQLGFQSRDRAMALKLT